MINTKKKDNTTDVDNFNLKNILQDLKKNKKVSNPKINLFSLFDEKNYNYKNINSSENIKEAYNLNKSFIKYLLKHKLIDTDLFKDDKDDILSYIYTNLYKNFNDDLFFICKRSF